MKTIFSLLLAGGIMLLSCQASRNHSATDFTVVNAYWYNLSGGQPGIGSTHYEIHITGVQEEKETTFENLILDGKKIAIDKTRKEKDTCILYAIESKSTRSIKKGEDEETRIRRPDFRSDNPQKATLTGTIGDKPFELEIRNFQEANRSLPKIPAPKQK